MKKIIIIIFFTIFLIVFILSIYKIYDYLQEENINKKLNNELIEKSVTCISDQLENNQEKDNRNSLPIKVDFSYLQKVNKDIVGWIYSEDSSINYPVVQSKDNQYYLRRLINGEYNIAGTIFMDYRNQSDLTDKNTIIYGHNMKNGTMFGSLQNYKKQEYYEKHKVLYFFTPEKNYIIELFAASTISVDSDIYNLSVIDQNKTINLIKQSDFISDVEVAKEDKIMTLSTCAYEYEEARYVLMGVLREIKTLNN